jgi:hypothetical protein
MLGLRIIISDNGSRTEKLSESFVSMERECFSFVYGDFTQIQFSPF